MQESLCFWAKTGGQGDVPWHPLVYHGLDVAAVFELLLSERFSFWHLFERCFSSTITDIAPALTALVALHDLGKVAKGFQAKDKAAWPADFLGSWPGPQARYDHAAGSAQLLASGGAFLDPFREASRASLQCLLTAVAFHHGQPMDRVIVSGTAMSRVELVRCGDDKLVAKALLSAFDASLLGLPKIGNRNAKRSSWLLSGLVSLADWIGSGSDFRFCAPSLSPRDYWLTVARPTALQAIKRLRLEPARPSAACGAHTMIEPSWQESPAQRLAAELPLPDGPTLVMIEDTTGSGKTEAALILGLRMMQHDKGAGLFVALPTTATADAMYSRMAEQYRNLFTHGSEPSLALAHGRRHLNDGFRDSIVPNGDHETADDETVGAACSAFFADDRRKVFLAEAGVGTIDQALLAILPTRYATLRLAGIASKILVIDEAHAYDAYMQKEVETLLAFHAASGGSAIILSATLPKGMKENYALAFRGLGPDDEVALDEPSYPLFSTISVGAKPVQREVAARDGSHRKVQVTRLDTSGDAFERVSRAAGQGACCIYIRNTVDDAIEALEALKERGHYPILFHARFAMKDRLNIERTVLATFGKNATPAQRRGRILVATQVAEQSLDLDFDVMASDLAPIDLLIQRAGRLWRHDRGPRLSPGPELLVVSPEPLEIVEKTWAAAAFPRGAYVYRDHGILWKTAKVLFEAGAIVSPDDLRRLIESVYGECGPKLPAALIDNESHSVGRASAETSLAKQNVLPLDDGYAGPKSLQAGWTSDVAIPTRLGEPQTLFRLARWENGALVPYAIEAASDDTFRAWALSEVSVSQRRAAGRGQTLPDIERAAQDIERPWRENGDGAIVLPLLRDAPPFAISLRSGEDKPKYFMGTYDNTCGLRIVALAR